MTGTVFPGTTGRGVRIAVIDSGVHPRHPHIDAARLLNGVAVSREGVIDGGSLATLDRLGHGTAVSAAIQERVSGAQLLPVRVFHDALRASATALVAAIGWCVDAGADIVNLSLGSQNPAHRDAFVRAAEDAAAAGVVLVAARSVDGISCWPGALPGVIGVELDWDCPRGRYRVADIDGTPAFFASGYPRPIEGVPPTRNLYGVSFAVAQMSGLAALALEQGRTGQAGTSDLAALLAATAPPATP